MAQHTLSVLVEDKPGVLARISALFSRRGFNITSLAVGPTEHPEISRMTIVVNVDSSPLEQVTKQTQQGLVEVIKIVESRQRRLRHPGAWCWSRSAPPPRTAARSSTWSRLFRAKVIDVAADAITMQVVGNADKITDFLRVLEPFGVRELVQSGMVAIGRGSRSISERGKPVAVPVPPAAHA
ncbi:acetolactate synthase small subunit [Nocardioides convexus]|uniref:acetolactate synthase small subunit n=1 Tax=Nocardioides convexus TaxID=2712224 RepID=UPI002418A237|nr:acetolactate synthase small subunit [Nocardioides convexus]